MKKLLLITALFICSFCSAQDFITKEDFNDKIAKDIVTIEFWAAWNSANEFKELVKLKDCTKYRLDITTNMEIQSKYSVSAIPTIIIFENGDEKERFGPNIMFQLEVDKKTIQNSIDTLILNKFQ